MGSPFTKGQQQASTTGLDRPFRGTDIPPTLIKWDDGTRKRPGNPITEKNADSLIRGSALICSRLPPLRTRTKHQGPEIGHREARPIFRPRCELRVTIDWGDLFQTARKGARGEGTGHRVCSNSRTAPRGKSETLPHQACALREIGTTPSLSLSQISGVNSDTQEGLPHLGPRGQGVRFSLHPDLSLSQHVSIVADG